GKSGHGWKRKRRSGSFDLCAENRSVRFLNPKLRGVIRLHIMTHRVDGPPPAGRAPCVTSWVTAGFAMTVLATSPALGQVFPGGAIDPTGRSGQPPGPLKGEFQRPQPPPSPVLPIVPLPPEGEAPRKPGAVQVFVRDIMVTGNTVFSDEEINQVTGPFKNRTLITEDLERLRLSLTLLYINKGYLTSGAIIPDQDIAAGVVAVHIIEGRLTNINVEGNRWFRTAYLHDRIELGTETPVRMEPLQDQLQILQQDRRIERINAELRPGDQQGESVLNVHVEDRQPFHATIEVNNYQTPLVGEFRGIGTLTDDNLTGNGDPLSISYGQSSGAFP